MNITLEKNCMFPSFKQRKKPCDLKFQMVLQPLYDLYPLVVQNIYGWQCLDYLMIVHQPPNRSTPAHDIWSEANFLKKLKSACAH